MLKMEDMKRIETGEEEKGASASATVEQEQDVSDVAPSSSREQNVANNKAHPRRKKRIVIGVAVVVAILIVVTLATVLTTDPEPAEPDPELYVRTLDNLGVNVSSSDAEIEEAVGVLTDYFLSTCSAGISVAVTRNGTRIVVPRGVMNLDEPDRLVDQDTLFEIGSVSKPVTGLVLAHEIVSGNLTVDTPLNAILPDSVPDLMVNNELVTLGQLVTHTSGFPRLPKVVRESQFDSFSDPNPYAGFTEDDLLREITIAASELSQTADYDYSNFGFSVLGYLLGKNTNTSFPALQRNLMEKLKLEHTWIDVPDEARQNLSVGYRNGQQVPYWFDGGLFINGAGSTLSSIRDVVSLVELLMMPEEKIQDDSELVEALQRALEPLHFFPTQSDSGVAFGWSFGGEPRWYAHDGATAGFVSYVAFQPASRTGIVALSNCGANAVEVLTLGNALASKLFLLPESQS